MNEQIRNSSENLSLIEILNSTLDQLNVYFDNSFLNQDKSSILKQLLKINIKSIQPNLADTIKVAITILYLVLYPQMVAAEDAFVNAPAGLKLRSGASTDSNVIQVLPQGTKVNVLHREAGWDSVDINCDNISDGYVYDRYLTSGSEETPAVVESQIKAKYTFPARNCNNGDLPLDAGNSVCYSDLHMGYTFIGEGFYAHNYTKWGKWIASLKVGDYIQINKDNGMVLNFTVSDRKLVSNASDASKILTPGYSSYLWTTNKALELQDPTAKIVFALTPN